MTLDEFYEFEQLFAAYQRIGKIRLELQDAFHPTKIIGPTRLDKLHLELREDVLKALSGVTQFRIQLSTGEK